MYWLRSIFTVNSLNDVKLLTKLYKNVSGELLVKHSKNKVPIKWEKNPFDKLTKHSKTKFPIKWGENPFVELMNHPRLSFPSSIATKISGTRYC
jgi:hypothetical protein